MQEELRHKSQHLDHLRETLQRDQTGKGELQLQLHKTMQVKSISHLKVFDSLNFEELSMFCDLVNLDKWLCLASARRKRTSNSASWAMTR